jgi:Ca2+-binding EF-hand superfamily protein
MGFYDIVALKQQMKDEGHTFAYERDAEMLRKTFQEVDDDGSGQLDREEVEKLLRMLEPDLSAKTVTPVVNRLFEEFDSDQSGFLDFEQFKKYWRREGKMNSELAKALRVAFDEVDDDGSGSLEQEEVEILIQMLEPETYNTAEKISAGATALLQASDEDGSGGVEFDEFTLYWKAHHQADKRKIRKLKQEVGRLRLKRTMDSMADSGGASVDNAVDDYSPPSSPRFQPRRPTWSRRRYQIWHTTIQQM